MLSSQNEKKEEETERPSHTFRVKLYDRNPAGSLFKWPGPSLVFQIDDFPPGTPIAVKENLLYEFKGVGLHHHPFYITTNHNGGGTRLFNMGQDQMELVYGSYPVYGHQNDSVFIRFSRTEGKPGYISRGKSIFLECAVHNWMGSQIYVLDKESTPSPRDFALRLLTDECALCGHYGDDNFIKLRCDCGVCSLSIVKEDKIGWCSHECMEKDPHHYGCEVDGIFEDVFKKIPIRKYPSRKKYVTTISGSNMKTKVNTFHLEKDLEWFKIKLFVTGIGVLAQVTNAVGDMMSLDWHIPGSNLSPRNIVEETLKIKPTDSARKILFKYVYNHKKKILSVEVSVVSDVSYLL